MANLNLKNIYKVYPNGTKAVNDFSLDIDDREFIVFVGPSGCGKSTVLRMIAGLEEISAGELKIDDRVVNDVECKLRDTAMVFQNYALYPHMTVADNMAFPIKMTKLTKAQKEDLRARTDSEYPPLMTKGQCKKAARRQIHDGDEAQVDALANDIYAAYLERKSKNAETRRLYKEGKKVELSEDDKAFAVRTVKEMPRSFRNTVLYPYHIWEVKHGLAVAARQERNLKRPVSVINNLLRPFHVAILKKSDMYEKVLQIAEILGLEDYLGKKPGAMSGGQRQRVALGRAMVRNPKVFLLDEPLSNLDAKLRTQMRSEITKLHNRLQTTFIYVTHDQVEAMTMGDRIVVMKKGNIQQTDTPLNLYTYPENKFVAGFIGTPSMNFFNATVDRSGDKASVVFANGKKLEFSAEYLKKFERKYLNKSVTMGVRPEDFVIDDNGVECVVLNSEMLGSETLLYCDFDTANMTNYENGKYPVVIKGEGVCLHKSGDVIKVSVKFDKMHFFDSESEVCVMKRFVSYNDIDVEAKDGQLIIGGAKATMPSALESLNGSYAAVFPSDAVTNGGDYQADVIECEHIKQGWLARLRVGTQYLYGVFDYEVSGRIGIDIQWHKIAFKSDTEEKAALDTVNAFDVVLEKRKLSAKNDKTDEKRKFDVDVVCGDKKLTCSTAMLKRLLSASDRKLFGIEMQLIFDENAIITFEEATVETFTAVVREVYDYGNKKFALCDCNGKTVVLPYEKGEKIEFSVALNKATLYDNILGIKIT